MGVKARDILEKAARRAARVQNAEEPVSPRSVFLRNGAHMGFSCLGDLGADVV